MQNDLSDTNNDSTTMKKIFIACICLAFTSFSFAQTVDRKWNLGVQGGREQYFGDLGHDFYQEKDQPVYGFVGFSVSRYLLPQLDVSLFGTRGEVGYIQKYPDLGRFRASMNTLNLILRVNILGSAAHVSPYIFGGVGAMMFDAKYSVPEKYSALTLPGGGGFNIRFGEVITLQLQETVIYGNKDNVDGVEGMHFDAFFQHTVGLTFNLGKSVDKDKDRVPDKKDKCLGTPPDVPVDETGCPLDRDKDGVPDFKDECPDGAGLAASNGCPDTDNDGVADSHDKCPDSKVGYKVNSDGCPLDDDNDGVLNEDDRCPDVAGLATLKGCPDTDGDEIPDIDDACPLVKGVMRNVNGCPETGSQPSVTTNGTMGTMGTRIYFDFNKSSLNSVSLPQLDAFVATIKQDESVSLSIEGFSDDFGDAAYNMVISKARAESVKKFLVSRGIAASRIVTSGYGEATPTVDNKNSANRAQNRRVEIKSSH